MTKKINFLDCTLRDGGYYNNWNFGSKMIQDYIVSIHKAGVNIVELGFRSNKKNGFKGACAYTTDEFINSFKFPDDLIIGIMINASEIIIDEKFSKECLDSLIPNHSNDSSVKLIRIACHFSEIFEALKATDYIKSLGYLVGINLMQIGERTPEEIKSIASNLNKFSIDVFYFADSLGNLQVDQVNSIIKIIKSFWKGEIGIHAHDNMSLALTNSLSALNEGATWVDSTITGMGRGAGNTKTEILSLEIAKLRNRDFNISALMSIIDSVFLPLKEKYRWGSSPYYYLSGMYGVHPTYVQQMISDKRYSDEDIIAALDHLKNVNAKHFSETELGISRNFYKGKPRGSWSPKAVFKNKEILLVGPGPSVIEHREGLESYIRRKNPLVLVLNTKRDLDSTLINYRICCHPIRVLADHTDFIKLGDPLIAPLSMMPDRINNEISSLNVFDYGISIKENQFEFRDSYCIIPSPIVLAYALATLTSGDAKNIFLAGFDGYEPNDPRRLEIDMILDLYRSTKDNKKLSSVTPTLYNIPEISIYSI